jgi:hypothetical protein
MYNPVTKQQLLFLLESAWRELWNRYQYMTEWWQPSNLQMQRDGYFDHNLYSINAK